MNIISLALTKRSSSSAEGDPAYNLFRRHEEPQLYCAVPEHYPVPSFIIGEAWDFGGRLDNAMAAPLGFDAGAARHGVALTGYYLFLADRRGHAHAAHDRLETGRA
ncbi:hypothetical protein ACTZWW_07740 [Salinarimonas sp. NSM]|uniref:hypothetical protein n=1 Tax=Salinarimonas sp. NSM TaxID=3458003 RepID=UPI0040353F5A